MSNPIPIAPTDGGDGGTYPPVTPTPPATTTTTSPTTTPTTPTPTPTPAPLPVASGRVSSLLMAVTEAVDTFIVPLAAIPSQTLAISLGNQACLIKVYSRSTGLYLDLSLSDRVICTGVICLDRNIIVRAAYLGFRGELVFIDSQGVSDPIYDGLGSRYNLIWLDY